MRMLRFTLLTLLALSMGCAAHRWEADYKHKVTSSITVSLIRLGADFDMAQKLAVCMADETEKTFPDQKQFEARLSEGLGRELFAKTLKICSCEKLKIPEALAADGFCKPAESKGL